MQNLILLFLLLLILSCNSPTDKQAEVKKEGSATKEPVPVKTKEEPVKAERYILEQAAKADFEQAATRHKVSFSMNPNEARKADGVLVLKINDKWTPILAFRDTLLNTDDPEIRAYRYLGQNAQLNQYLVAGNFYEGFETYLVDKTTGKITATWTEPSVSPDQKYFVNASLATAMEGEPTGIQVWRIIESGKYPAIEKYLEIEQQEWEPFELHWESSRTIIIKMIPIDKYEQLQADLKEEDFAYLRLKLK